MDNLFFYLSKMIWFVISPDHALVLIFAIGLGLTYTTKAMLGRRILLMVAISFLCITFFPIGQWLLHPLEMKYQPNPKLPENVHGIIVLGGAEIQETSALSGRPQLNEAADRITGFISLVNQYPNARAIYTGDSGLLRSKWPGGADIAEQLFLDMGLAPGRVEYERDSRNTYENALLTKAMVNPKPGETWILVTSAYHMPRSVGIFSKLGWAVVPYPVDQAGKPFNMFTVQIGLATNLSQLTKAVKEWVGLMAYRMTGKTEKLLP